MQRDRDPSGRDEPMPSTREVLDPVHRGHKGNKPAPAPARDREKGTPEDGVLTQDSLPPG
jgi:hypothetical protein